MIATATVATIIIEEESTLKPLARMEIFIWRLFLAVLYSYTPNLEIRVRQRRRLRFFRGDGRCYRGEASCSNLRNMFPRRGYITGGEGGRGEASHTDQVSLVLRRARCRIAARARSTPTVTGVRLKREPNLVHSRYPSACSASPRFLAYSPPVCVCVCKWCGT